MMRRFFGLSPDNSSPDLEAVFVNNYRIQFDTPGELSRGKVTVGYLRKLVADIVKTDEFTLIYAGKKLTNDNSSLVSYGIRPDSRILCSLPKSHKKHTKSASKPKAVPPPPAPPQSSCEKIDALVHDTENNIVPLIEKFEAEPPADKKHQDLEHRKLGELVLQKMVALDGIDTTGDADARAKRKEAINALHKYHTRIDKARPV
ncbi:hypothetical protein CANCADRAFT_43338 [Tortispora caseinolytica NRRL Y-17796]|uniref:BAG domain-containing protein n=1 Tax=Tortispora caseinolytica NRRL Y-17796 TaxID=767744 RepID=A0A1E4TLX1_9ASCO|nr:hypothetical protein CANCADRAFT_43338 [Tortispora caseinolytica NRRL Y-17796]